MVERDIHYGKPQVKDALYNLEVILKQYKRSEKIIKIVTGYGSSGGSHKIRTAVVDYLDNLKETHYIKDYIFGNELDMFSTKYLNFKYRSLIPECEKKILNKGCVFIIL